MPIGFNDAHFFDLDEYTWALIFSLSKMYEITDSDIFELFRILIYEEDITKKTFNFFLRFRAYPDRPIEVLDESPDESPDESTNRSLVV